MLAERQTVAELPLSELVTAQLMEAVECARVRAGGKQAVGLSRWMYHVPTMRGEQGPRGERATPMGVAEEVMVRGGGAAACRFA